MTKKKLVGLGSVGVASIGFTVVSLGLGQASPLEEANQGLVMAGQSSARLVFGNIPRDVTTGMAGVSRDAVAFRYSGSGMSGGIGVTVWGAISGMRVHEDFDGGGKETAFGVGYDFGDVEVGVVKSFSDHFYYTPSGTVSTESDQWGAYVGWDFGADWHVDGLLLFGDTEAVSGNVAEGDRFAAVASVSKTLIYSGFEIEPFASFAHVSEEYSAGSFGGTTVGAHTISSYTAALGSKATYIGEGIVHPYVSLAAEFTGYDDGLGSSGDHFSPRFGAGFEIDGSMADVHAGYSAGSMIDGTWDESVGVSLSLDF
ncbi:hypothetical protein [Pseudoruegeria sp. HB172150]|uniref:hypothetical protein n=1 Tax=Pseudoruegeria sp. HB172150 TaxID=2721164 RepID=UPI0015566935|nr:hypothetical protein [Pseudoruegeria sp. HB172150]